jgi:hypothetical protein
MKIGIFFKEYAVHTRQGIENLFSNNIQPYKLYYNDVRQKYDLTITLDDWPHIITPVMSKYKILVCFEPEFINKYSKSFLNQFDEIHSANKKIAKLNYQTHHVGFPWHFTATIDEIKSIRPDKPSGRSICMISSSKNLTDQHKTRLQNVDFLMKNISSKVDLYGRGFTDFSDKAKLLSRYQFAIVMENVSQPHYISEKLTDCFLTQTYPIYYGCPNVHDYYPVGSCLDLTHIPRSQWAHTIDHFLNNNSYERLIEKLKVARTRYFELYSLDKLLKRVVTNDLIKHRSLSVNFNTSLCRRLS